MPIATQIANISALVVSVLNEYITRHKQDIIPNIGNSGTKGTLKGRFRFGSFFLKIITDTQIAINAVNVP